MLLNVFVQEFRTILFHVHFAIYIRLLCTYNQGEKKLLKIFMFSVYLSLAWASDGAATHASVKQVGPQN
jgi:hypothetical protein